jgi:hypothetical protein
MTQFRVTSQFKAKAHAKFASSLHHLDDLKREPNWKEEEYLFRALGYMKRGNYKLAGAEMAELDGMFARAEKPGEAPEGGRERYTIERLRKGLAELREK